MTVQERLGIEPAHRLSWADLVLRDGIPQDLIGVEGLYVVYVNGQLGYIGRTRNLCFRLGQLIAALCGSTGDKVSRGHHVAWGWDYPADATLEFEVFTGAAAYAQERPLITATSPRFNRG